MIAAADLLECVWTAVLAAAGSPLLLNTGCPRWPSCVIAARAVRGVCADWAGTGSLPRYDGNPVGVHQSRLATIADMFRYSVLV